MIDVTENWGQIMSPSAVPENKNLIKNKSNNHITGKVVIKIQSIREKDADHWQMVSRNQTKNQSVDEKIAPPTAFDRTANKNKYLFIKLISVYAY